MFIKYIRFLLIMEEIKLRLGEGYNFHIRNRKYVEIIYSGDFNNYTYLITVISGVYDRVSEEALSEISYPLYAPKVIGSEFIVSNHVFSIKDFKANKLELTVETAEEYLKRETTPR